MADEYILALLRHAKSDYPAGVGDHERPLSARGKRDASAIADIVASRLGDIDLALVSTATRAQQTWELSGITSAPQRDEPRIYEASTATLLEILTGVEADVRTLVMVGHNPGFEDLARKLAGQDSEADALTRMNEKYPTCALAIVCSPHAFSQWQSVPAALRSFDVARGSG